MLRTTLAALCLALVPAVSPPAPASVDAYVERYRAATGLPGAVVAITRNGKVIHTRGYGRTATGEPVTADTPMAVASVSKSFTAVAVMQLAEQGKVALDQPVRRYLPEFTMADPRAGEITVRQLLNQTSGMADSAFHEKSLPQPRTLQGAVARLRTAKLATQPGTAYSYHNTNYQVAARLVEVVSGRPFAGYLRTHVFAPLGMGNSRTVDTDRDLPGSARGHLVVLGQAIAVPEPTGFGNGSGGVISTANDMARWLIAQDHGILSPGSVEQLRTPSAQNPKYALGWMIGRTERGTPVLEHDGDLFTATAAQSLMSGYGVAVMANTGTAYGDADALMNGIIAMLEGDAPRIPSWPPYLATDILFTLLTLATAGLAVRGVARSRRWAGGWLRLVWYPIPLVLCVVIVPVMRVLLRGGDITWIQIGYLYPAFMIWLVTAAAAGLTVLAARLWSRTRRATPQDR